MLFMKQALFAKNLALLIQFIFNQGQLVTMGEAWRPPEMAMIYAKEHKGISHSLHCKRLAVDINIHSLDGTYLLDAKSYEAAGKYWESLDYRNKWGGGFQHGDCKGDFTHFQMNDEDNYLQTNKYLTGPR